MSTLRLSAPSTTNKYYMSSAYGGYNDCLRISGVSCLPNCVGYCWGAWFEMMRVRPKLSRSNACNWYGYTADGYTRSRSPELGAIACWGGNSSNHYGHVAIVTGIFSNYITVAQSNYGGYRWNMTRCYKMANGLYKSAGGNTNMQGFILLPSQYKVAVTNNSTSTSTGGSVKTWDLSKKYGKGKKFVVRNTNGKGLNMRSYPSTSGKVICTVPQGATIYYYGRGAMNGNICWYYVAYGKKEGYVYGGKYNSGVAPYLTNANP